MSPANPSIQLRLYAGAMTLSPVPEAVAEAWQSLEVTQTDEAPGALQMTFHADRNLSLEPDYDLLSSSVLRTGGRIGATISLNGQTIVLFDGFITNQELSHTTSFGASTISVIAQDVSVMMDLHHISYQYPGMLDPAIVAYVLTRYAIFGVVPMIVPPLSALILDPLLDVPAQNSTDRAYLQQLAQPYGHVFFVRPALTIGLNTAYWGPPPRFTAPQPALSVNVGPASNVERISFTHDGLSASLVLGEVQDEETDEVFPVITTSGMRLPPFAARPAWLYDLPLVSSNLFGDPRPTTPRALVEAQANTDRSTDNVVVGQGQLDVLHYGSILEAPGVVGVRGVGETYDGNYYVQRVTHRISRGSYKQEFTLKREGVGTTVSSVTV
jgi:hypothetical protein